MKAGNLFISNFDKMQKGYFKILYKPLLLMLPVLLLTVVYLKLDPFKVLYHYDTYFVSGEAPVVELNKDYVTTEMFLHNYKKYNYDSYIFGSSRSMFYEVKDWQQCIGNSSCFHFDAWKESLYGIYLKCMLLDHKNLPVKNALIVLDTSVLAETGDSYREANLYMKHPFLSGSNRVVFQYECLKAFFNPVFLSAYIKYKISGKRPSNEDVFDLRPIFYNDTVNEIHWYYTEKQLAENPDRYYSEHANWFVKKNMGTSKVVIGGKQKLMLEKIHDIFIERHTNYKLIISPHYTEVQLNPEDLHYLEGLFGKENVFDFSGKNEIADDKHNFYDGGHYRPQVARYILSIVYGKQ
jgi:hypothetical protein